MKQNAKPLTSFNPDSIHIKILEELRADSRISITSLAQKLGISRSNAYERIKSLEDAGVIKRYTIDINPVPLGKQIAALVFVSITQSMWKDFAKQLASLEDLDYFAMTTGEYDAMLLLRADDVSGIQRLVVDVISHFDCVQDTETVFLMHEERADYSLHPSEKADDLMQTLGILGFSAKLKGGERQIDN